MKREKEKWTDSIWERGYERAEMRGRGLDKLAPSFSSKRPSLPPETG
jgi:hypothetical protein